MLISNPGTLCPISSFVSSPHHITCQLDIGNPPVVARVLVLQNTIIKVWLVLCFVRKIYSPWASFDCFMPIRPLLWNAIFLLILKPTWSVLSRSTSQAGSLTLKDVMNLWLFDQVVNLIQQSFLAVGIHRKHVVVCYLIVHFVMTYAWFVCATANCECSPLSRKWWKKGSKEGQKVGKHTAWAFAVIA